MEDIDIRPFVDGAANEVLAARRMTAHLRQIFCSEKADTVRVTEEEIKQLIIDVLQLEDITPADIDAQAPLFVEGLGLDSIDALELGVALQKRYGIILSAKAEENRRHFASVRALTEMIEKVRKNEEQSK